MRLYVNQQDQQAIDDLFQHLYRSSAQSGLPDPEAEAKRWATCSGAAGSSVTIATITTTVATTATAAMAVRMTAASTTAVAS